MDPTDINIIIDFHSINALSNAINNMFIKAPMPATLGAKAKKAVTEVGEPS